jgi:hypothetical protein
MTCCGVSYLVIATLAMIGTFASLWLPFIVISETIENGNGDDIDAHHHLVSSHAASKEPSLSGGGAKSRHMTRQELSLSDDTLKCPFLDGPCYLGSIELHDEYGLEMNTDDLLINSGCSSLGAIMDPMKARAWSIAAAFWSFAAWVMAVVHAVKGANLGSSARWVKIGAAVLSGLHVGTSGMAVILEGMVVACFWNSAEKVLDVLPGTYTIVPLSLIALCCSSTMQFWNGVGMVASWFTSCCGAPAGRDCTAVMIYTQDMYEHQLNAVPGT